MYSCAGQTRVDATLGAANARGIANAGRGHDQPLERAPPLDRDARYARRAVGERAQASLHPPPSLRRHGVAGQRLPSARQRERDRDVDVRAGVPPRARAIRPGRRCPAETLRRHPRRPIRRRHRIDRNQSDTSISSKADNVQPARTTGSSPGRSSQARATRPRERRLARAKVARERHDHARRSAARVARASASPAALGVASQHHADAQSHGLRSNADVITSAHGSANALGRRTTSSDLGTRARVRRDRHRGYRPRRGGSAPAELARRRSPRRDGLYGAPRRAPFATGRARAGHGARHHRATRLLARRRARCAGGARRSDARLRLALRARPRLSQGAAPAVAAAGRPDRRERRRLRLSRVHRQRAGAGSRARREKRHRLARQAHAAADARRAPGSSSARSTPTCRCRPRRRPRAHCGTCTACIDCVPDRRDRRAVRARRAPLHQLPDDRAGRRRFPSRCGRWSATGSTAATTASSSCPWNRFADDGGAAGFRRRCETSSTTRGSSTCSRGHATTFERRMEGSAIRRIGYERWLRNIAVALGNAPADPAIVAALRARADDRLAARARARRVGARHGRRSAREPALTA